MNNSTRIGFVIYVSEVASQLVPSCHSYFKVCWPDTFCSVSNKKPSNVTLYFLTRPLLWNIWKYELWQICNCTIIHDSYYVPLKSMSHPVVKLVLGQVCWLNNKQGNCYISPTLVINNYMIAEVHLNAVVQKQQLVKSKLVSDSLNDWKIICKELI